MTTGGTGRSTEADRRKILDAVKRANADDRRPTEAAEIAVIAADNGDWTLAMSVSTEPGSEVVCLHFATLDDVDGVEERVVEDYGCLLIDSRQALLALRGIIDIAIAK